MYKFNLYILFKRCILLLEGNQHKEFLCGPTTKMEGDGEKGKIQSNNQANGISGLITNLFAATFK